MTDRSPFLRETEALRDLRVLEAVEADPTVSQRELARELGVAVGVVNACVHALVRKGLLKVQGDSNRSISYHLTKPGVLHKSALALQWTRNTIDFYRQARAQVASTLAGLAEQGHRRAVVFGAAELAEITALVAPASGIEIVALVTSGHDPLGPAVAGIPVVGLREASTRLAADPGGATIDLVLLTEDAGISDLEQLTVLAPHAERFSLIGEDTDTPARSEKGTR
jgi:DNA-binding MarR family transcriptional regulator